MKYILIHEVRCSSTFIPLNVHGTNHKIGLRIRKYALGPVGQRAVVPTPQRLETVAYSASAVIGVDREKPMFLDIRANSNSAEDFAAFMTLAVASGFFKRGDFLVHDNAAVHFGDTFDELQELFEENGITTIVLPTYSPELNPIERCFGIVKHYLRYNRGNLPLVDEIVLGFGRITMEMIAKEYLCSVDYFVKHPFLLPPALERLILQ